MIWRDGSISRCLRSTTSGHGQLPASFADLALRLASSEREVGGVPGSFVAVGDSGSGIAPPDREHLFDPSFTTKTSDGTGPGLCISLGLVQRYGGRIDVNCPATGGAVFTEWRPNEGSVV